jgi:UDP-N-acetyl-D-galactosamine dehydrogenase
MTRASIQRWQRPSIHTAMDMPANALPTFWKASHTKNGKTKSKVVDVIKRLNEYDIYPIVSDPLAEKSEVMDEYNIGLIDFSEINNVDCLIFAVAHDQYKKLSFEQVDELFTKDGTDKVLIDVKSIFDRKIFNIPGFKYWRL